MNISIFGAGYVGLVTGACLADVGHKVLCIDLNAAKIDQLRQGRIPIWEPGLEAIVARNIAEGRLLFSTEAADAAAHGSIVFVAVGTPPAPPVPTTPPTAPGATSQALTVRSLPPAVKAMADCMGAGRS